MHYQIWQLDTILSHVELKEEYARNTGIKSFHFALEKTFHLILPNHLQLKVKKLNYRGEVVMSLNIKWKKNIRCD